MKRRYYAIEYAYGSDVLNNGQRADRVMHFDSKEERNTWVAEGPPPIGPGERMPISATEYHRLVG
jgi:hypothetical protein